MRPNTHAQPDRLSLYRYHTGAERTWDRTRFLNMTALNITRAIKSLYVPKAYAPGQTRASSDDAGFNEVCIPPGSELPARMQFAQYSQTTANPGANDGTQMHTTSMVPRKLRSVDGTNPNPLHGNPRAVKRWALHFLLGFGENMTDPFGPEEYFNPVHYARSHIRVGKGAHPFPGACPCRLTVLQANKDGRVYESAIHRLTEPSGLYGKVAPYIRNYVTTFRGTNPGILHDSTKDAYTRSNLGGLYNLSDYFRICPKVRRSRRHARDPYCNSCAFLAGLLRGCGASHGKDGAALGSRAAPTRLP